MFFFIPMRHINPSKEITIEYPSGISETAEVVLSDPATGDLIVNEDGELKRYGNTGKYKTACCGFWFPVGRSRYWFEFLGSYKA